MAGNEASTKQAIAFGEGLGPGFTLYSMQKWKRSVQIMTQGAYRHAFDHEIITNS